MPGRVTNVRPGLIVGPDDGTDRFTYWPVRVARGGEVLAPNRPEDAVQFIDVRDLGTWIVKCLDAKTIGVFNATGNPLPVGTLLDTCKATSGSDATFTWVDAAFLEAQKVSAWSDLPCWLPPTGEDAGGNQREQRARRRQGPRVPAAAGTRARTRSPGGRRSRRSGTPS